MKKMKKDFIVGHDKIKEIMEERKMLSLFSHPNIVNLHCSFQSKTYLFLIFEFCNGGDLFGHINVESDYSTLPICRGKGISGLFETRAKFYSAEIFLALQFLHENGVIYRDLKPENILLDRHGHTKLCDLGLAKRLKISGNVDPTKIKTNTVVGTREYFAPEMIECMSVNEENKVVAADNYTPAVDWWCFGVLLAEFIYGENIVKETYYRWIGSKLMKSKKKKRYSQFSATELMKIPFEEVLELLKEANKDYLKDDQSKKNESEEVKESESKSDIAEDEGNFEDDGIALEKDELEKWYNSKDINEDWYYYVVANYDILLPESKVFVYDKKRDTMVAITDRKISENCFDLIKKLLKRNPSERIGYKNNKEIMNHPFFVGNNKNFWEDLKSGKIKPPMIPNLQDEMDLKYIDKNCLSVKRSEFGKVLDEFDGVKITDGIKKVTKFHQQLFRGFSFYQSFGETDEIEVEKPKSSRSMYMSKKLATRKKLKLGNPKKKKKVRIFKKKKIIKKKVKKKK